MEDYLGHVAAQATIGALAMARGLTGQGRTHAKKIVSKLVHSALRLAAWKDPLAEMQLIIDAENSDLFDVLAFVAYAEAPLTREERAERANAVIGTQFNDKQQAFLSFVLAHYVSAGVEELDETKLGPLLKLKYNNAIADAFADLGTPDSVRKTFVGFQRYLYPG